jgi:hypothetical protein
MISPTGGKNSVVDEGTQMALKAILPALMAQKKSSAQPTQGSQAKANGTNSSAQPTQGSQAKATGQTQPKSATPASPGGPGVTSIGNGANMVQLMRSLGITK